MLITAADAEAIRQAILDKLDDEYSGWRGVRELARHPVTEYGIGRFFVRGVDGDTVHLQGVERHDPMYASESGFRITVRREPGGRWIVLDIEHYATPKVKAYAS